MFKQYPIWVFAIRMGEIRYTPWFKWVKDNFGYCQALPLSATQSTQPIKSI
jgi:hypothetical protein